MTAALNGRKVMRPFRPRARVLQLLGDELIGSARLAVFELVKNAYDADANEVEVCLDLTSTKGPTITVSDDGEGMTLETLRTVWLVPGDDHRQRQRLSGQRTSRHRRLPLGEKGLGRFAVHKLGNRITLVTRAKGTEEECVVDIDWNELIESPFLDEALVTITTRPPKRFSGKQSGTRIKVRELRTDWSRGEVRRLHNQITSICSPFEEPSGFHATLRVPGREQWVDDLPDVSEILARAIWKFSFRLYNGRFDWSYEFRQPPGLKLNRKTVEKAGNRLQLPSQAGDDRRGKKVVAEKADFKGIGTTTGEFYVYDRDREVRKGIPNLRMLENYLDEAGGVRVYRDGIRVYNYGEQGDDWLGLDLRRVNAPKRRISRNIILGAVHLSLRESTGLVEKTNREGFVENAACRRLRRIVLGVLSAFEAERLVDKERMRRLTAKPDDPTTAKIDEPLEGLRREAKRQGLTDRFEPYLVKIEHDYRDMQETLLSAGMSGLNLAVVFHEVERGVRMLQQSISEGADRDEAASQARDLTTLLGGFSTVLRRDSKRQHSVRTLVKSMRQYNALRLRYHRVDLTCLPPQANDGFQSHFNFNLVLGALNNLVDNALYWLRVRWPEAAVQGASSNRKLYVGTSDDFHVGPAIVVADNGVGFQEDDPERLVRPFFTRKPDGMGLGLYYANLAMELNGGQLVFPRLGEIDLPIEFDGAVVALIFKEPK